MENFKEKTGLVSEKELLVGGWSSFEPLTEEDKEIFNEVMKNYVGVDYVPFEVSKQIVNGTNYRFRCKAKGVYPGATEELCIVEIYKPIKGEPRLVSIKNVDSYSEQNTELLGGWSPYEPLTAESKFVFAEATERIEGVVYTPFKVSTQVVAGMNYRFRCEAQIVYPGAKPYLVIMQVFKPLHGKAVITSIEKI
ncbi:hypothetical protein [Aureivirga sp. CE67]|uniref:hypothetical protein n=1 Tax=Aureivirga sp. CE67 TaxID=1788983 RepID=UPI0018C98573|nr:hypothetical protein [Aureivirga sp. CE67]